MEFQNIYFLGIGGIGMSALARYFLHEGKRVAGYDRTPSHLTDELAAEGAAIHFEDDVRRIPAEFLDPAATMVVYTPAVPQEHGEYQYFVSHGFCVEKRSQMLGHLAEGKYVMAVAGTHGKTTTSTLVAWLNRGVTGGGSAFLGGISKNFGGNLVLGAVLIALGANLLVDNGTLIAQALGVPESVIALTFVALGTSLPELVTAITSLVKGCSDLSLGNVVGANVFNLVLVSGMSVTLAPFEIPQSATLFGINSSLVLELPVMLLVMALLTIPALVRGKLSRVQGVALLCIYAAFCAVQFTM